jgi:hypothetical protein
VRLRELARAESRRLGAQALAVPAPRQGLTMAWTFLVIVVLIALAAYLRRRM